MTSEVSRRPLFFRPQGVIWLQQDGDGIHLSFPGPLDEEKWQILAQTSHPQIANVRERGESFADGALIQFAPKSGYLDRSQASFSTIRNIEELHRFFVDQGSPVAEEAWVRMTTSRSGTPFFVCVPCNMDGEKGWVKLDPVSATSLSAQRYSDEHEHSESEYENFGPSKIPVSEEGTPQVELPPTRRLPIHKRVRFRLGAAITVTAITLSAFAVLLPMQIEAARRACPSAEQVQVRIEELLRTRADALEQGDLDKLREVESEHLVQIDARMLEKNSGGNGIVAPEYEVEVIERLCEADTVIVEAMVTSSVKKDSSNVTHEESTTREVTVSMTRNPWKIDSFNNQK